MATLQNFKKTRIRHQSPIFGKEPNPRYHAKKLLWRQTTAAASLSSLAGSSVISFGRIGIGHDGFLLRRSIIAVAACIKRPRSVMRYLMVLLTLLPTCALAQELSVEDRACITAAAGKLPPIAALEIKGSRVQPQPPAQGRRDPNLYNTMVEIDVSVAGQSSTYVFNCVSRGQLVVIQPMGLR